MVGRDKLHAGKIVSLLNEELHHEDVCGVDVYEVDPRFLTWALDKDDWAIFTPRQLYPGKEPPVPVG